VNDKQSKVFAYIGYPDGPAPKGGFPGIVLIHGGGGTAYPEYIKLWTAHGYAVIAIDWYNQRPLIADPAKVFETDLKCEPLEGGKRQNHVAIITNIILAHSLLRSLPNVAKDNIGFVGLSWGSWYGSIIAAADSRYKFIINIYCGGVNKSDKNIINGRFLHSAKMPVYWIAGTNDQNITPLQLQDAFDECPTIYNKTIEINLPHAHCGFRFADCFRVADTFLKSGVSLPKLGKPTVKDGVISAKLLEQGKGIKECVLCYTCDSAEATTWKRVWKKASAELRDGVVSAKLPEGVFQCFINVYDEAGSMYYQKTGASSDFVFFPAK
jgi:dienelactone hydrolase